MDSQRLDSQIRILNGGFSKVDSQRSDSLESDFWASKSLESKSGSLGNPSVDNISFKTKFGNQQLMNLGIQKKRGTQLRARWSDSHAVSSVLRPVYAKSVDLQICRIPYWSCVDPTSPTFEAWTRHGGVQRPVYFCIYIFFGLRTHAANDDTTYEQT